VRGEHASVVAVRALTPWCCTEALTSSAAAQLDPVTYEALLPAAPGASVSTIQERPWRPRPDWSEADAAAASRAAPLPLAYTDEAAGAAWYRERALAIDDLSGQLSLAVQMLKIAQRRGYKQRIGPILHQLEYAAHRGSRSEAWGGGG